MKFHLIQTGAVGRREDIEARMAGQNRDVYQRYLDEVRGYVQFAEELGYASYGHNEHHLQIEGFEVTSHPGMFSLFIGLHSKHMKVSTLGYVLPTHNPVRAAEEIASLDHMLKGRTLIGFTRGFQARWVDQYATVAGARATTPTLAKAKADSDTINREIFEECIQIVKKAWTNSTFSHDGKYWKFPADAEGSPGHPAYETFGAGVGPDGRVHEIGIAPLPYQTPHPKIYGGFAHSMRTIKMWAREGGKPIVQANDLDFCEVLWRAYSEEAEAAGHEIAKDDVAAWGGVLILADTKEEQERKYAEHKWFWDTWFAPFGQQNPSVLMGTADEIGEQIEKAHDRLGFNEMFLAFGQGHLDPDENNEELHKFATEVAPRFSTKDENGLWV